MDSVVHLLHRALAEAIASRRGDISAEPVTVAEIYQELVPYRSVRSGVGFEMNADYEHALLRLLSGEDALVRLEPEEARSHLARELATPNPDVTLFRRYAACDVWVSTPLPGEGLPEGDPDAPDAWRTPGWLDDAAPPKPESARSWNEPEPPPSEAIQPPARPERASPEAQTPLPPASAQSREEAAEWSFAPAAPPAEPAERTAPSGPAMEREMPSAPAAAGPLVCSFCGGVLPPDRAVKYCPYCGVDQQLRPCARCGEVLEAGWRYCVSCGAPAPAVVAP